MSTIVQPSGPSTLASSAASTIPAASPTQPLVPAGEATAAVAAGTCCAKSCPCDSQKMCISHFMCWLGSGLLFLGLLFALIKYKDVIATHKMSK